MQWLLILQNLGPTSELYLAPSTWTPIGDSERMIAAGSSQAVLAAYRLFSGETLPPQDLPVGGLE